MVAKLLFGCTSVATKLPRDLPAMQPLHESKAPKHCVDSVRIHQASPPCKSVEVYAALSCSYFKMGVKCREPLALHVEGEAGANDA